jgi:hypothetical protein
VTAWRRCGAAAVATVDDFDVVEVVAEQLFKSCRGVLHGVDAGGEVGEQLGAGLVELLGEIVGSNGGPDSPRPIPTHAVQSLVAFLPRPRSP